MPRNRDSNCSNSGAFSSGSCPWAGTGEPAEHAEIRLPDAELVAPEPICACRCYVFSHLHATPNDDSGVARPGTSERHARPNPDTRQRRESPVVKARTTRPNSTSARAANLAEFDPRALGAYLDVRAPVQKEGSAAAGAGTCRSRARVDMVRKTRGDRALMFTPRAGGDASAGSL